MAPIALMFMILVVTGITVAILLPWARRQGAEIKAQREQEIAAGFRHPSPNAVGMPIPGILRSLHEGTDCSQLRNFKVVLPEGFNDPLDSVYIARFLPLHPVSLKFFDSEQFPNCFPFAEDEFGNPYYVTCNGSDDPPVNYFNGDADNTIEIAPSLTNFLAFERKPRP